MDRLSSCASLPQIVSYVNPNDVIRCLQINKRINSVVTNNWKRMKKPAVGLNMTAEKRGFVVAELVHFHNVRSKPKKFEMLKITKSGIILEQVTSPVLITKLSEPAKVVFSRSLAPQLQQFLSFLLPRIEIRNLYLDNPFSLSENLAVVESFGEFYSGFIPDIISSEKCPLYKELPKIGNTRPLDSYWLGNLHSGLLYEHMEQFDSTHPTCISTDNFIKPDMMSHTIWMWQRKKLNNVHVRLVSTQYKFSKMQLRKSMEKLAERFGCELLPWIGSHFESYFWMTSYFRNKGPKHLLVRQIGNSVEIREY